MKFIHVADSHLGNPLNGITIKEDDPKSTFLFNSLFKTFINIIDLAISNDVDFILFAGDLYNTTNRSIYVEDFLGKQFFRLKEKNIKVYIIHGNHDFSNDGIPHLPWGDNVVEFNNNGRADILETKNQEKVAVVGISYADRHIEKSLLDKYQTRRDDVDYQIGLYHGEVDSNQSNYAPVKLEDIKILGYDYFALGHIHIAQVLSENPYVAYSGSIQGLNKKEVGPHGVIYVQSNQDKTLNVEFIHTNEIEWKNLDIELDTNQELDLIMQTIKQKLDDSIFSVYSLNIKDINNEFNDALAVRINFGTFKDELNLFLEDKDVFVANTDIAENIDQEDDKLPDIDQAIWEQTAKEVFDGDIFLKELITRFKEPEERFIVDYFNNSDILHDIYKKTQSLINNSKGDQDED
ncbi:MAG: DNA repair exonuclease [Lactobacillaceae bacterium]|jgi:DNA repair exonuclease SbcCD nuclease subunit|nr:DNA repair exonuclease [Lactobacillaceae bacterium]